MVLCNKYKLVQKCKNEIVEGQLQGAIVHTVKQIGYDNVKEIQFEVVQKVITDDKNVFMWFIMLVPFTISS